MALGVALLPARPLLRPCWWSASPGRHTPIGGQRRRGWLRRRGCSKRSIGGLATFVAVERVDDLAQLPIQDLGESTEEAESNASDRRYQVSRIAAQSICQLQPRPSAIDPRQFHESFEPLLLLGQTARRRGELRRMLRAVELIDTLRTNATERRRAPERLAIAKACAHRRCPATPRVRASPGSAFAAAPRKQGRLMGRWHIGRCTCRPSPSPLILPRGRSPRAIGRRELRARDRPTSHLEDIGSTPRPHGRRELDEGALRSDEGERSWSTLRSCLLRTIRGVAVDLLSHRATSCSGGDSSALPFP